MPARVGRHADRLSMGGRRMATGSCRVIAASMPPRSPPARPGIVARRPAQAKCAPISVLRTPFASLPLVRSRRAPRCRRDNAIAEVPHVVGRGSQPRARRPGRARGARRGAAGQRPAELHAGRPGRHRGQGVARARARGAAAERLRVSAQQAHHGQPGAGRPAQGVGPLRPADRAGHPGGRRPARRGAAGGATNSPASCRWPASCARCAARWRWRWRCAAAAARARWCCRPTARAPRRRWAGCDVRAASHLAEVVAALLPGDAAVPLPPAAAAAAPAGAAGRPTCATSRARPPPSARWRSPPPARHSLLLVGPPGTGKSMLAQRLPGLLPPLDDDEALASAALAGLTTTGAFDAAPRPAPGARAAPHGQRGGAGGRRLAAAAGRDLAGPRRRAVPRRDCPSSRAPRSRRCASRWRPAASPSRARRGRPAFRRASSSSRR